MGITLANPYQKTMLGSSILFLNIYLAVTVYSILPFTINQFLPGLDLTPASVGWSSFSAVSNSTMVDLTANTLSAYSIGGALPLVMLCIVLTVILFIVFSSSYAYDHITGENKKC